MLKTYHADKREINKQETKLGASNQKFLDAPLEKAHPVTS